MTTEVLVAVKKKEYEDSGLTLKDYVTTLKSNMDEVTGIKFNDDFQAEPFTPPPTGTAKVANQWDSYTVYRIGTAFDGSPTLIVKVTGTVTA